MISRLTLAVEGRTDEIIARHILSYCGFSGSPRLVNGAGKQTILKKLPKYNEAAKAANYEGSVSLYVVLLDLDNHDCVRDYVHNLIIKPEKRLIIRVAVREIESWIMADREHFARFIGVARENIPRHPDLEQDPKATMFDLIRKGKGRTALQRDMLPAPGASIGSGYTTRIREFVTHKTYPWRPDVAAHHSESLSRCIQALKKWI